MEEVLLLQLLLLVLLVFETQQAVGQERQGLCASSAC